MSFIDGIVNAAKTVLGIDSSPDKPSKRASTSDAPKRSENLATDTPTAFERGSDTTTPQRSSGPTLAERVERIRSTPTTSTSPSTSTSRGSIPPHLVGERSSTPPVDSASIEDAASGAATAGGAANSDTATRGAASASSATARIYEASSGQELGTSATLSGSDSATAAARHVQKGLDYFASTFGRNGVDGAGAGVNVLINDRSTDEHGKERFAGNGGYYATTQQDGSVTEAIHFGTGKEYDAARGHVQQYEMLWADDLAIHELTHGIIRKETGYLGGEADEAGATNEGIADVMAAAATRDWSIGEGMYGEDSDYRRMRNIAKPNDPSAIHGLWTSMDEVRSRQQAGEEVEEHWASGVISTAAQRVQDRFGDEAGWQVVEKVFYDSIDGNRLGDMSFTAVASGLRSSAAAVYGTDSSVAKVFDEELRRAGL